MSPASRWADPQSFFRQRFDYLIIGAGTAGSVVASRLSEDPNVVVGVIEAGAADSRSDAIDIPGRYGESLGSTFDYAYRTKPQPSAASREIDVPRGKGLGGTSLLNFMVWMRPNADDIDQWHDLGNHGWKWQTLLDYYRKSESLHEPTTRQQNEFRCHIDKTQHGHAGPVPVQFAKELCLSGQPFHEALNNLSIATNEGAYGGSNVGVFSSLVNVDPHTGHRAHAAHTYLRPHEQRPNLHILTDTEVNRVVLSEIASGHRATGVEVSHNGQPHTINASREVIISSGTFLSPVLLEKSGIGRPEVLKDLGIPVKVANVNVGEKYQDHSMLAVIYEIDPSTSTRDDLSDETLAAQADAQFAIDQTGPRALLSTTLAYLDMNDFVGADKLREVLKGPLQAGDVRHGPISRYVGGTKYGQMEYIPIVGQFSPYFQAPPGKKHLTLLQIQQYPFTTGTVHGKKHGDHIVPDVDPELFQGTNGEIDLELHVVAMEEVVNKIEAAEPMTSFIRKRVWPPEDIRDAESYRSWVRENATFDWHPVGTCRMGGDGGAATGVVDEHLRVYGVEGLRVVDASIMPYQICAHPQATITAIAEMASDLIKMDQHAGGAA